jgi:hypothetical protein
MSDIKIEGEKEDKYSWVEPFGEKDLLIKIESY